MTMPMPITPVVSLDRNGPPTATQIQRIDHTVAVLKRNEAKIREKLQLFERNRSSEFQADLIQHTNEVSWGWKDLLRLVCTVPDTFIDKAMWQQECQNGLDRADVRLSEILSKTINDIS